MSEHTDKYEAISQKIGINNLRTILESEVVATVWGKPRRFRFPTPADMQELAKQDEHLNNVPLQTWGACDGRVRQLVKTSKAAAAWSLSDTVCTLKHVARYHYKETLAEEQARQPKPEPTFGAFKDDSPENEQITLASFITKHNLKFACHRVDSRPDGLMSDNAMRHFRCRITRPATRNGLDPGKARSFGLYFSQGSAHTEDPTLADVLDCLASDASGYENAYGNGGTRFEQWAEEYGYEADSRKAEKIFRAVKRQAEQLKRCIGSDAYSELLWNTERL